MYGTCRGSGGKTYVVDVLCEFTRHGALASIDGACSCPVAHNCKHCVALALVGFHIIDEDIEVAPASTPVREPEWKQQLSRVFPSWLQTPRQQVMPLALQFEVTTPSIAQTSPTRFGGSGALRKRSKHEGARLDIRPVTRGKTKQWVRNAITWSAIRGRSASGFDLGTLEVFQRLCDLADRTSYYSPSGSVPVSVGSLEGGAWWEIVGDLSARHVPFLFAPYNSPVVVETQPAHTTIDVVSLPQGDLVISAEVSHPHASKGAHLYILGEIPHSVIWLEQQDLHLAQVKNPPSNAWSRLLREGGKVEVPATASKEFTRSVFPSLARAGWTSSDDSFMPPTPQHPTLVLHLDTETTETDIPQIRLLWQWQYRDEDGDDLPAASLYPGFGEYGRDERTESEILAQVAREVAAYPRSVRDAPGTIEESTSMSGLAAANFVDQCVPALQKLGVQVMTTNLPQYRRADSVHVQLSVNEDSHSNDWLDLEVEVLIGGHEVPLAHLIAALVRDDDALFLPDGSYLPLDNPEFDHLRRLLHEAQSLGDGKAGRLKVRPQQLSWWEEMLDLDIVQTASSQWFDSLKKAIETPPVEAPIPSGLRANLRSYQVEGFRWMANLRRQGLGGILADDMGLGKTVQTLAMIADQRETGSTERPWLVVAPTSVVENWADEAHRFTPTLKVEVIKGTAARRTQSLSTIAEGQDILITSFALLRLDEEEYAELDWAGLIVDEAQNAKNYRAKVFKALVKTGAPVTYAITGTPVENNLTELWSMLTLVAPGMMGSPKQFAQTYRKPIDNGGLEGEQMMALLRRRIAPFLLRRTKEKVALDLPEKQEQIWPVILESGHRRLYDQHLHRERQRVLGLLEDTEHNQIEILASLTRLRQLSIDPALVEEKSRVESSKTQELLKVLNEVLVDGHRVIVFSQFTRYLRRIAKELDDRGIAYSYLDGSTTDRGRVLQGFREGSAPVFLMSLKAGGVGINLTEADYAILTDPWWNPAVESQAIARTHRIGQTRPVHVYRLVAKDTIEEKMLSLQEKKRKLAHALLDEQSGAQATSGARLSAEDIQLLFDF